MYDSEMLSTPEDLCKSGYTITTHYADKNPCLDFKRDGFSLWLLSHSIRPYASFILSFNEW